MGMPELEIYSMIGAEGFGRLAAKVCQAEVIPIGTARVTDAKTSGAAHIVER
jgi:hypothetical protein